MPFPKQQFDTQEAMPVRQLESTVKADEAQIENIKLQLFYSRITSPLTRAHRVAHGGPWKSIVRSVDVGPLAVVTQLQPRSRCCLISVKTALPGGQSEACSGRKIAGYCVGSRSWKTWRLGAGTLLTIDNQIDQASGTVRFKASFANENLELFPNPVSWNCAAAGGYGA